MRRKSHAFQPAAPQAKSTRKLRKGLAPLQFVGEGLAEPGDSSCERVTINENDIVERDLVVPKRLDVIYSEEDLRVNDKEEIEEFNNFNQFDEPPNDLCDPEIQTGVQSPNGTFEPHPVCPLDAILTPNLETASNEGLLPKECSNDLNRKQDSCDLTQKIPRNHKEKGRKRLLLGSNLEENNCEENMSSLGFVVSHVLSEDNDICDKNKTDSPLKSKLKERHLIFSNIPEHTPERPKRNGDYKILAYDTPEEEYGLTVRQRILKKYKKQKTKR